MNSQHKQHQTNSKVGIGLRPKHYQVITDSTPKIDFLEVHSENYFDENSADYYYLQQASHHYPLSFHGIGLSLGSDEQVSTKHLTLLKNIVDQFNPFLVSDHLSWSSLQGAYFNDLLPIPYTDEALARFVSNVNQVQEFLGRQIIIENPSSYLQFKDSNIHEADFLNSLSQQTGCGLLLDINNIYVSACNHGFSAQDYLNKIHFENVQEIHLAGHTRKQLDNGEILIDTHNQRVCDAVWELFKNNINNLQHAATLIEWDTDLPELAVLLAEKDKALQIVQGAK